MEFKMVHCASFSRALARSSWDTLRSDGVHHENDAIAAFGGRLVG
jgi:hypothetical protein